MPENLIAGRYRLDEMLGRGGMSEVWAATDTELGRRVALKLLAPNADTARFEREARAVASLGHPNITQLYDYGEADGRPYMVLEYLPGGTLEERLRDGRALPDEDTRRISAELAAGLAHAHARGVVHRDLKPGNVLFDQEGRAKLNDFGIARMAAGEGTLTEAGTVLGTAAYISPEQAAGASASAASDVYSFGVMLYRMLTGRLPFESNDPMELVALHRDSEPPPLTQLRGDAPALLESAATAALAKDPADRPRDGAALMAALGVPSGFSSVTTTGRGFADPDATSVLPIAAAPGAGAPPPPAGPPLYPPVGPPRRSRAPLVAAALLVLLLAGGAVAYEMTRPASGSPPDTVPITLPKTTTHKLTQSTTTAATTVPSTTQSTPQTTTQRATTAPPTTHATTTALPPTTTVPPPVTTAPPATTAAPPTTTAPPPTTTASVPAPTPVP
jgi:serine/threonine protein kinase